MNDPIPKARTIDLVKYQVVYKVLPELLMDLQATKHLTEMAISAFSEKGQVLDSTLTCRTEEPNPANPEDRESDGTLTPYWSVYISAKVIPHG